MMTRSIYFLALLISQAIWSQNIQRYSPEELQEDFELFRLAMQEAHPGLYRYADKAEMNSLFDKAKASLTDSLNQQQFYLKLLPIISEIGCGHTKFLPSEHPEYNFYYNTNTLLPLQVHVEDDGAFVLNSYTANEIKAGSRILSINGVRMEFIIEKLLKSLFSDGANLTFKYYELNKFFNGLYSNMFVDVENPVQSFDLVYLEDEVQKTINLQPISLEAYNQLKEKAEDKPPYELELRQQDNLAILTIRTFWSYGEWNFKKFLDRSFEQINGANVENLILDVRNNEGGIDAYGTLLLSYLVDRPFEYYDRMEAVTNKQFTFHKNARLPKHFGILRTLFLKRYNDRYVWTKSKGLKIQRPLKDPFLGNVYVLINGGCFSVTSEFAAVADHLGRAIFIGEETGGGYLGNNSGAFAIVNLSNTKIDLGIPLLAYYTAVGKSENKDRGVLPDIHIRPTIGQLISGEDEVLNKTLEMVN